MIDIVLSADEGYAPYGAVVMASALANTNTPERLRFSWLTPGLSDTTKNNLRAMVESKGGQLSVITVAPTDLEGGQLGRFGEASLLRLNMHRYLPDDCQRVIYLDCDLLVLGDLAELWKLPLVGSPVGAVLDLCGPKQLASRQNADSYFNSGVLLIDLERWRDQAIGEQAMNYLANAEGLSFPDQDALNHVLAGAWTRLPMAWNFQPAAYAAVEKRYAHLEQTLPELEQAIHKPNVVHFIGAKKPWDPLSTHPLQDLFLAYSQQTAWPIDRKAMRKSLPLSQRVRLAMKEGKIRRRRKLTER